MNKAQKQKKREDEIVNKALEKQAKEFADFMDNSLFVLELTDDLREQNGLTYAVGHSPKFLY